MQEMLVQSLGQEDTLEKEMATHSSILAWKIPWTEESGGKQFMGSQSDLATQQCQKYQLSWPSLLVMCGKAYLQIKSGNSKVQEIRTWTYESAESIIQSMTES